MNSKSSCEYVNALADAMEAHECALRNKILNRDITNSGNMVITNEGSGLLIDWDLCLNLSEKPEGARRPERTGTWQFMSTPSLTFNPVKVQAMGINDDQESFLYVLSWIALLYTKYSQLNSLPTLLKDYNDFNVNYFGKITGGQYKRYFLATGLSDLEFTDRPSLGALIDKLRLHFHDLRTLSTPTQEDKDDLEEMKRIGKIMYQRDKTYKHELLVQRLNNRKWLVETFRKHLATGSWPKDDAAERNSSFLVSDMTEFTDLRLERWSWNGTRNLKRGRPG